MASASTIKVAFFLRDGNRYLKPFKTGNQKYKALCGIVPGETEPQKFPDGVYVLRFQENGKRKWEKVASVCPRNSLNSLN